MELRKQMKELRIQKGWTQEYVANKLFVSPKTISHWESGKRQMDSDAIETLCELYGYDMQPEEKKESNIGVVSLSDILKDPNMSLSAREVLGRREVTLRVEIKQKVKQSVRQMAEERNMELNQFVENALTFYADYLHAQESLEREEDGYRLYLDYYEKEIYLSREEAGILLMLYKKVAEAQNFEPDVTTVHDMMSSQEHLTTVIYHVTGFATNYPAYKRIEGLMSELLEEEKEQ